MYKDIIHVLLQRMLVETDGLGLWWAISRACAQVVGAVTSELYLRYDDEATHELREILPEQGAPDGEGRESYKLVRTIPLKSGTRRYLVVQAAQRNEILARGGSEGLVKLAVPLHGPPGWHASSLAVVVLRLHARNSFEETVSQATGTLTELLNQVWPISVYAGIRYPKLRLLPEHQLEELLDTVLNTLCFKLGFRFATVSLVDEDRRKIQTVAGRNAPWVGEAHHLLTGKDIQADILRTGKVEVISEWDERLDKAIWELHRHEDLIRIFVPLLGVDGPVGTIEAGFRKDECKEIPPLLKAVVERYARLDVTAAVQNARIYERERRHSVTLLMLQEASYKLLTGPRHETASSWLNQVVQAARDVLEADIPLLYLREQSSPGEPNGLRFMLPICGDVDMQEYDDLASPNEPNNIVYHIATSVATVASGHVGYYQPDVESDHWLKGSSSRERSFTERHGVCSFAGVALRVRDELLGVLCLNYRQRREFTERQRRIIELFTQHVAAVIVERSVPERLKAERDAVWEEAAFAAAHKLGNPIYALETNLNNLEWGIEHDIGNPLAYAREMRFSLEKAKHILKQFKAFNQGIIPDPVRVVPLIEQSCRLLHEQGVRVEINVQADPLIMGDETKLIECFDELAANALHWFDKPTKEIIIAIDLVDTVVLAERSRNPKQHVRVYFADNGCGVPDDRKDRIFVPFHTTFEHGTGLGLPIVHKIIESHGGAIREIGKPGIGAVFEVILPLAPDVPEDGAKGGMNCA
jgi:signal transduction histidine kinase